MAACSRSRAWASKALHQYAVRPAAPLARASGKRRRLGDDASRGHLSPWRATWASGGLIKLYLCRHGIWLAGLPVKGTALFTRLECRTLPKLQTGLVLGCWEIVRKHFLYAQGPGSVHRHGQHGFFDLPPHAAT